MITNDLARATTKQSPLTEPDLSVGFKGGQLEDWLNEGGEIEDDNLLIHGDNLVALDMLYEKFRERVKCIFIDPPYNTGLGFSQYKDDVDHAGWLKFMEPRLSAMWELLAPEGAIWIAIDDHEGHYLKVLCDRLFGRSSFISSIIWQKRAVPKITATNVSSSHDYILLYAKDPSLLNLNFPSKTKEIEHFRNTYPSSPLSDWAHWESAEKTPIRSLWLSSEVGDNEEAKSESREIFPGDPFATPKPERLLARIIEYTTATGDIVLDAFAGSGTTAAVAQKLNRHWISIEAGEHAITHARFRITQLLEGTDASAPTLDLNQMSQKAFKTLTVDAPTKNNEAQKQ